jgi:outer membrane protein TolC
VQRSELFPRLSAFFNYTYSAQENGALNFFGQNPSQRTASSAVGLRLEVPVFSGGQRWNRVQQRKIAVRQVEQQLAEATKQAESEVRSTLEQVSEAAARASAQRKAVGQAQRGFEIANAQYLAGTGARIELTEAELALRQAELNYAQAVYDYLTARARLDLAVGVVPEADAALQRMWEKPGDLPPVTATEGRRATDG